MLVFYSVNSFAQRNDKQKSQFAIASLQKLKVNPELSNAAINQFIKEVFDRKSDELVFNNKQRLESITSFLTKRYFIIERRETYGEKLKKLSEIPLYNRYNKRLQRNIVFNPHNFNPLKYQLDIFSTKKRSYRIDNTDYVLIIYPVSI